MSSGFGPRVQPKWVRPSGRKFELTLITELHRSVTHWDVRLGRSRRCGGAACEMCAVGCQKQLRVFVMGVDGSGNDWLFELRERHRETFDRYESTVGLVVNIWRAGQAKNSPVMVAVTGQRTVAERDITALVKTFGLDPQMREGMGAFEEVPLRVSQLVGEGDRLNARSEWEG